MTLSRRDTLLGTASVWMGLLAPSAASAVEVPRHLPGELSAEALLNGQYAYPPSPRFTPTADTLGLAPDRLRRPPKPGVHPRILTSPDERADIRRRLETTTMGKALVQAARARTSAALRAPGAWSSQLYAALAAGDLKTSQVLVTARRGLPSDIGHYKPWLYAIVLEAELAWIFDDAAAGRVAATALATYAELIRPSIEAALAAPMNDDVWRVKIGGAVTGANNSDQGMRAAMGYHLMGYGYDFAHGFMTLAQRAVVRDLIALNTKGRVWDGARLPHHFRNWNHITVALQQPLLALAIEGEEGYDARVYRLGVEIARDYLTYSISPDGVSTEAIGYIQFGFVWGNPFMVAAARRGDNLLVHGHFRAMLNWYVHCLAPGRRYWTSRGDGGDTAPAAWTLAMWRHLFPGDPRVQHLWGALCDSAPRKDGQLFQDDIHILEMLLWAEGDAPAPPARALNLPTTLHDPLRGSLIARTGWDDNAAMLSFETRVDSVCASHEHADRGSFTFHALGRAWAKDNFRSVETRHHNSLLIDGKGQGYWPGPGAWLEYGETDQAIFAATDQKAAYDWAWPKQIITEPEDFIRFKYDRWADYAVEARRFRQRHHGVRLERDDRPAVKAFWTGFTAGDPRMWDEDSWPVRMSHNPVRKACRSILFHKGPQPWLLVADDIRKDEQERLYEWLMQTGLDTEVLSIAGDDIVLTDPGAGRNPERRLLVRVLAMNEPGAFIDYQARPSFRLETFERRDTLEPSSPTNALAGSRSFGLDKRLVIASRSVEPRFRVLLYPLAKGAPPPTTELTDDGKALVIASGARKQTVSLTPKGDWTALRLLAT